MNKSNQLLKIVLLALFGYFPSTIFSEQSTDTITSLNTNTTTILKQIHCSTETGDTVSETISTYSFQFNKKPTEYYYEYKIKESEIVFSFTKTESEINTDTITNCQPIKTITIKKENDSLIKAIIKLDKLPQIHVFDTGNVILFDYKWTSDTSKLKNYIVKEKKIYGWPLLLGYIINISVVIGIVWLAISHSK
jgi:hypothetical protein